MNGNKGSDLTIGYYDKTKFSGQLHWNKVVFKYMYGIQFTDLKINGKSTGICQKMKCLITVDSGTAEMYMPNVATEHL